MQDNKIKIKIRDICFPSIFCLTVLANKRFLSFKPNLFKCFSRIVLRVPAFRQSLTLPFRPCSPSPNPNLDSSKTSFIFFYFLHRGVLLVSLGSWYNASITAGLGRKNDPQNRYRPGKRWKKKEAADPLRCSLGCQFKYLLLYPNTFRWYCWWCGTDPGFSSHRFLSVCRIDWALPNSSTNMVDCTV